MNTNYHYQALDLTLVHITHAPLPHPRILGVQGGDAGGDKYRGEDFPGRPQLDACARLGGGGASAGE